MELQTELDSTKKEQEDLLVLLADQDTKLSSYKTKLKDLGQNVSFAFKWIISVTKNYLIFFYRLLMMRMMTWMMMMMKTMIKF